MKALISTTEIFDYEWVSSWEYDDINKLWIPIYSLIVNCQRVAQVVADDKTFEVYRTLIWVDCPDDCVADQWYYKDNQCCIKPSSVPEPATPVEVLP
jgi:hypothetical protein